MNNLISRKMTRGGMSAAQIIVAYREAFSVPWWRVIVDMLIRLFGFGGIFQLADAYYQELDDEGEQRLFEFLDRDMTDLEKYIAEDFDCDDFTFRLMGEIHKDPVLCSMPIFITWVSWKHEGQRLGHAVLSYYKSGAIGVVKIAEPQNDQVKPVRESWRLDLLCG